MKKPFLLIMMLALMGLALTAPIGGVDQAQAMSLEEAIAQTPTGTEKGQIDPSAEPGFLGIPGAPQPNLVYGLLWAV